MSDLGDLPSNFTMAEMPSAEALAILNEADLLSQSFELVDQAIAAGAVRGSLRHTDLEVVSRGLPIVEWLISPELNKGLYEAEAGDTGRAYFPTTDSSILKNMVSELSGGARSVHLEPAQRSLGILAVLALDSKYIPEARQAIGRVGKYSPHVEIADLALDSLQGILKRDEVEPDLLEDPDSLTGSTGSALIAVHAVGQREEATIRQRASGILDRFEEVRGHNPRMLRLLESAKRSVLTPVSLSFNAQ